MLDLKSSSNKNNWAWENPNNGQARDQRDYPGDHSAGELYNGKWYVFSGLCCQSYCHGSNTIGSCGAYNKVQIYDPSTDQWSLGANIPWFVDGGMSSAEINGECIGLYLACPLCTVCLSMLLNDNFKLRCTDDYVGGVGLMYVCGGMEFKAAKSLAKCGIYNPSTNSWNTNMPAMPQDVHHTASGTGQSQPEDSVLYQLPT